MTTVQLFVACFVIFQPVGNHIVDIFDKNNVAYQVGGFSKVDEGGGGTVAKFLAYFGIRTVDIGPALLSMHSLFEVSSKADIYEAYKAYKAFYSIK